MMSKTGRALLLAAGFAAALAVPAAGRPAQIETTKPIVLKLPKHKLEKFKGVVLAANIASIMVRSRDNEKVIRTFQYSEKARAKMLEIIDKGGYQYGDKVEVLAEPGSNVAVQIKGKPSKPR